MIPEKWSYESIEAWYPKTLWNQSEFEIAIGGDHEDYDGRSNYASIGGCYYAVRLSVTEHLEKIKRQASVLVLREIHPGYIMPVGVWQTREATRNILKQKALKMKSLNEVIEFVKEKMDIPLSVWIKNSWLLKNLLYQKKISSFLSN